MLHDLLETETSLGILNEELGDEVFRPSRHVGGKLEVDLCDPSVGLRVTLRFEGRIAHEKLVAENPERPDVDVLVVRLTLYHLRRKVVESSTERVPLRGWSMDGPTKVSDLDLALAVYQEVLRLDVSVDHVLLVAVGERTSKRADVVCRSLLGEPFHLLQLLVELSASCELEDEVDAALVVEVAVQAEDVGVSQVGLDLDLSSQLMLHTSLG
mmetsp:Transcript_26252/g.59573  ORF Transcript_26252/g.59573 Transcript_26252/m.59573 type:complete len:212 (-) Transcript_26252:129-764(-)